MMKLKALIFDIDGTVYSNNLMHLHTIPLVLRHFKVMMQFSRARKKLHYCSDEIDSSGLSFHQFQAKLLADLLKISPEKAQQELDFFRSQWEKIFDHIRPYKDFRSTVEYFKAKNLKMGLLSDFPVGRKIERLKLNGLWDAELCTEDFGAIKPDPRSFLQAAARLGVQPEECLFVGNSHSFDVIGANAAGMKSAHLQWGKAKKNSQADFTFYHYKDLQQWIDHLLNES